MVMTQGGDRRPRRSLSRIFLVAAVALGPVACAADSGTVRTDASQAPLPSTTPAFRALGVYAGYGADGVATLAGYEQELGRNLRFVDLNVGHQTWPDFRGSIQGNYLDRGAFNTRGDVTTALTVPLRVSTAGRETLQSGGAQRIRADLQAVADGRHDDAYLTLGNRLVSSGHPHAIIRLGHEQDIEFYPWSVRNGNEDVYIAAFRHVVGVLRGIPGNQFVIDYQGNGSFSETYTSPRTGIEQPYGDAAYPGDDVVDVIGVDVYNRGGWETVQSTLDYTLDLAQRHGKPMSIPEWGLWVSESGDDPGFIENMYAWINAMPAAGPGSLVYHSYFWRHREADLGRAPQAKAKFLELFGGPASPPPAEPEPEPESPIGEVPDEPVPSAPNTPTPEPEATAKAVLDVTIVPGSLRTTPLVAPAGARVVFRATIKNVSAEPTPAGVVHGVAFLVNGNVIAWSDTSMASLAPGATRTLSANSGPWQRAGWRATGGTHEIEAIWDDIGRLAEANEANNTLTRRFTVRPRFTATRPARVSHPVVVRR